VLTVANFNMHSGIDGWGRPYDFLDACRSLGADVLVLEEAWTSNDDPPGQGQAERIAHALGYQVVTCTLAEGRRIRPQPDASERWLPRVAFARANKAHYFDCVRPLSPATRAMERFMQADQGSWGIAVLVRPELPIGATRTLHLPTLSRDRVRRAALVVDITVDSVPISVIGTHMAHLHMGSFRHYARLRDLLRTEARSNAVLLGDMNLWGPPVRVMLREWHRAVKGRTWPTWHPHSQIDHILVRGAVQIISGEVLPHAGSDHRPVRAELTVG
jgi:endonuclease/exonuclease/phosphatase family metal-dependent hydrolase